MTHGTHIRAHACAHTLALITLIVFLWITDSRSMMGLDFTELDSSNHYLFLRLDKEDPSLNNKSMKKQKEKGKRKRNSRDKKWLW